MVIHGVVFRQPRGGRAVRGEAGRLFRPAVRDAGRDAVCRNSQPSAQSSDELPEFIKGMYEPFNGFPRIFVLHEEQCSFWNDSSVSV